MSEGKRLVDFRHDADFEVHKCIQCVDSDDVTASCERCVTERKEVIDALCQDLTTMRKAFIDKNLEIGTLKMDLAAARETIAAKDREIERYVPPIDWARVKPCCFGRAYASYSPICRACNSDMRNHCQNGGQGR